MSDKVYLRRESNNAEQVKKTQNLLVTGASGLLGNWIIALAADKYHVIPTDIVESNHQHTVKLDLTDANGVHQLFQNVNPTVVIHTASETNVDRCETERERAWKINVIGTDNIVDACMKNNVKLISISTDYVFDGEETLYTEDDAPNPIDFYGLTKLEGERRVIRSCEKWAILRTSVLYGRHPTKQDFATWVINKLKQSQEITVVDDHFNTPTLAENLAKMALEISNRELNGVFHTSGCERISRYDFARKIGETFELDISLIKPIKMNDLKAWIAKRPKDSSLDTAKIQTELATKPLSINEGLSKLKEELRA